MTSKKPKGEKGTPIAWLSPDGKTDDEFEEEFVGTMMKMVREGEGPIRTEDADGKSAGDAVKEAFLGAVKK